MGDPKQRSTNSTRQNFSEANNLLQADKLRAQQQLEALQARYVGTGHADTTKFEWTSNIQRDSYASYVGHPPLLSYMAVGMGECREKVRAGFIEVCCYLGVGQRLRESRQFEIRGWVYDYMLIGLQKMIQPVGKPPEVQE